MAYIRGIIEKLKDKAEAYRVYEQYRSGKIEREDIPRERVRDVRRLFKVNLKRMRRWLKIRAAVRDAVLSITVKPINRLKKPVKIDWRREIVDDVLSGSYPFCPICGEYAYSLERCVFCGRRFENGKKKSG